MLHESERSWIPVVKASSWERPYAEDTPVGHPLSFEPRNGVGALRNPIGELKKLRLREV